MAAILPSNIDHVGADTLGDIDIVRIPRVKARRTIVMECLERMTATLGRVLVLPMLVQVAQVYGWHNRALSVLLES